MKLIQISINFRNKYYWLHPYLGITLVGKTESKKRNKKVALPEKVLRGTKYYTNPFLLKPYLSDINNLEIRSSVRASIILMYLNFIRRLSFLLLWKSKVFFKPCFQDANEAIEFFRSKTTNYDQSSLCLLRSFFVAYTSKRFNDGGILVIGVFLPSKSLHAWIIEDGQQPDDFDIEWVNYQPIAILY